MEIELHEITIQEIVKYSKHLSECQGYTDDGEDGVHGMEGRLNIRPIYQREFIYKDAQRNAVIKSIKNNFPLNVLYWVENKNGSYEVLDGQQRLISIGQYVSGAFSIEWPDAGSLYFHNLTKDQQDQILNYKLMVYFCEGTDSEKLDWFRIINIVGEKLTDQELRNAIFAGPWVSDAKRYFSRNGCAAYQMGSNLLKGHAIRQNYLETVIKWISNNNTESYMADRQHTKDAKELWAYFEEVISWIQKLFPSYRKEMKGTPFGILYNEHSKNKYDPDSLEKQIAGLMQDEDVTKKSGIYEYVITMDERKLNIRAFSESNRREIYELQKGKCIFCGDHFEIEEMEADHITPWSKGGKTISENCQMLCLKCNRAKSSK